MTGNKPLKIVADENIAYARHFFAEDAELLLRPGRSIGRADIHDADVLLVRSVTPVNRALLEGTTVRFVGSCTIGTDHVDTQWLADNGIHFAYAPGCNAQAVVEYVLSALSALDVDLLASKVGIVGCGNVGGRLLRYLQKQGVNVVGYDPFLAYDPFLTCDSTRLHGSMPLVDFETILSCDVICLHTPLTRNSAYPTFHLFGQTVLDRLKPGAVLLNAGRGAVIDNTALLQRLENQGDLRVVLDVWENEPSISHELLVQVAIGTPHIAGYSAEGKLRGTEMVYESLCDFLGKEKSIAPIVLDGSAAPYNIFSDDAALREQYPIDAALAFDRLRKHYKPRRECGLL